MSDFTYLSVDEVIFLNRALIMKYSPHESTGVLHQDLLESAVYRPIQSVLGEDAYPTIFLKAAALFESLALNHSFHNANKRTAFAALVQFLYYNDYVFRMHPKEAENFTVDVVQHDYKFVEIAAAIEQNSVKKA